MKARATPWIAILWLFGHLTSGVVGKLGHADSGKQVVAPTESVTALEVSVGSGMVASGPHGTLCPLEELPLPVGGCGSYQGL